MSGSKEACLIERTGLSFRNANINRDFTEASTGWGNARSGFLGETVQNSNGGAR